MESDRNVDKVGKGKWGQAGWREKAEAAQAQQQEE